MSGGRRGRLPAPPRVEMRIKQKLARDGFGYLYHRDRKLALALRNARNAYAEELGGEPSASADALCWTLAEVKLRRDTIAALVLELGPAVVNKKRKHLYPIVRELGEVERLFADLLKQFTELKVTADFERRLEALERGEVIDAAP